MKAYVVKDVNADMRYHDLMGEKTPILFIHGLGCISSFDFPVVASEPDLAAHRRILVDLLGSGFSDKPAHFCYSIADHAEYLADFIDSIGLSECILYGHSMGGAIALSVANRIGHKLKAIVLSEGTLDSGGGFYSRKVAGYNENDYLNFGHEKLIVESINESNKNWAACLSMSLPKAIYKEAQSLVRGSTPAWRDILYALNVPRTYIFGELSLPAQVQNHEALEKHAIHIEVVKNAGHSMAWENPKGLAAAIKRGIDLAIV